MKIDTLSFRPFGERAIEILWPQEISLSVLKEIRAASSAIANFYGPLLEDGIPSYANLLILFSNPINPGEEIGKLKELLRNSILEDNTFCNRWLIPVCYDPEFGLDLDNFCRTKSLSLEEFVRMHSEKDYPIHFFGFLPGFFYLGGLDQHLHFPRKKTPRSKVAKGTVAIGGSQTGIYPQDSPGGWQLIGRTPVELFNPKLTPPVFAEVGDVIRFVPVDRSACETIEELGQTYQVKKELIK